MINNENKIQYELLYPNLEWLFGMCLSLPLQNNMKINLWDNDKIIGERKILYTKDYKEWDENNPIYCYICDYENGDREIVRIPIIEVLNKINHFHNYKKNNKQWRDDIDFVIESCIRERLKLIN
jgi:hypothetical protein